MLRIFLICFSIGLIYQPTIGQHCIPTAIVFSTQSQVDNFSIDYPGCSIIDGNVGIAGDNITNLNGLSQITQILGSVQILNATVLTNISGLNNVSQIGGFLKIENNTLLNINGFNGLLSTGGDITLNNNHTTNLSCFTSLTMIGGKLDISEYYLSSLTGFQNLTYIAGNLIFDASQLNEIPGFQNLTHIGGGISISSGSASYLILSGFQNLQQIGGSFSIYIYGSIIITGLNNLVRIGGSIALSNFFDLNISGLNNLKTIGSVFYMMGGISGINAFSGLSQLDSVYSSFTINKTGNTGVNVSVFNNIKYFGNSVTFTGAMTNFGNFSYIDTIYGSLTINSNPSVSELSCFTSLKRIKDDLKINTNNILTAITGFQNLTLVKNLNISTHNFLSSISGFNHPMNITNSITITGNPFLSTCAVQGICDNIWKPTVVSTINNNNTGCATKAQVQQNCPPLPDADGDGIPDIIDNCPNVANPTQTDTNNNGIGDACDVIPDTDGDGINDQLDNCKFVFNPDQADDNNNGIGNVCEDGDSDGIPNIVDNCPTVSNPHQTDLNNNGIGDACEVFPKTGINTTNPKAELHLSNGSLYLDNPEKGIIFKAYNGNCYILRATGNTNPQFTLVPCPQ